MAIHHVNTTQALQDFLALLHNIPSATDLYIATTPRLPDYTAPLSLLQIRTATGHDIYIIDIHILGGAAFTINHNGTSIKTIFQSQEIRKIFFDVRYALHNLKDQHGISLNNMVDLQLVKRHLTAPRSKDGRRNSTQLRYCIRYDCDITLENKNEMFDLKRDLAKRYENTAKLWLVRPVDDMVWKNAVVDITYLPELYRNYAATMQDGDWQAVRWETERRLAETLTFNNPRVNKNWEGGTLGYKDDARNHTAVMRTADHNKDDQVDGLEEKTKQELTRGATTTPIQPLKVQVPIPSRILRSRAKQPAASGGERRQASVPQARQHLELTVQQDQEASKPSDPSAKKKTPKKKSPKKKSPEKIIDDQRSLEKEAHHGTGHERDSTEKKSRKKKKKKKHRGARKEDTDQQPVSPNKNKRGDTGDGPGDVEATEFTMLRGKVDKGKGEITDSMASDQEAVKPKTSNTENTGGASIWFCNHKCGFCGTCRPALLP
ncbi:Hypothetical protein D9617_6g092780 [Elsinoe fawcettii]|nr:Hypothetical protein D9617_6g092780 [Elsinoe fawcettii]